MVSVRVGSSPVARNGYSSTMLSIVYMIRVRDRVGVRSSPVAFKEDSPLCHS
jgi:hypothetical protein